MSKVEQLLEESGLAVLPTRTFTAFVSFVPEASASVPYEVFVAQGDVHATLYFPNPGAVCAWLRERRVNPEDGRWL